MVGINSNLNNGQKTPIEQMSDQELNNKIAELAIAGEDFSEYKKEVETRKTKSQSNINTQANLSQDVLDILNNTKLKKKEKEDAIKKILDTHIQTQEHEKKTLSTAKDTAIDDLKNQLNDTKNNYEELLNADDKIITPAEYTRRSRLRSIKNKFISLKTDPKKALAYFLTKTSFLKWGKATASLKRAGLFLRSLSSFSTMGVEQINKMKKEIQEAIDEMKPKDKDTITTKHLKESIRSEVAKTANAYFEQITKPIDTKFAV